MDPKVKIFPRPSLLSCASSSPPCPSPVMSNTRDTFWEPSPLPEDGWGARGSQQLSPVHQAASPSEPALVDELDALLKMLQPAGTEAAGEEGRAGCPCRAPGHPKNSTSATPKRFPPPWSHRRSVGAEILPVPGEGNELGDIPEVFWRDQGVRVMPGAQPAGKGTQILTVILPKTPAPPREKGRDASREGRGREGKGEREREGGKGGGDILTPSQRGVHSTDMSMDCCLHSQKHNRSCWQSRESTPP